MTIKKFLNLLKNVKQRGSQWSATCPAHNDKTPSLFIREGEEGKIVIICRAGCTPESVVQALGLTMRDLFPRRESNSSANKIVATYDYRDEDGKVLYQVVRFPDKKFRQRRPDGKGGWIWKVGGVTKVPYRLPELLKAPKDELVFIVEGEKDADNLAELGLIATTNAGGASTWPKKLNKYFEGRHIVILPDNDEPGRKHAKKVRKELISL